MKQLTVDEAIELGLKWTGPSREIIDLPVCCVCGEKDATIGDGELGGWFCGSCYQEVKDKGGTSIFGFLAIESALAAARNFAEIELGTLDDYIIPIKLDIRGKQARRLVKVFGLSDVLAPYDALRGGRGRGIRRRQ